MKRFADIRIAGLAALVAAGCSPAPPEGSRDVTSPRGEAPDAVQSPSEQPSKKRAGPAPVAPVVRDGIRYEAVPWGRVRGLDQNGGHVKASDAVTMEELWILKVYDLDYDPELEDDKQDIFITALALSPHGDHLVVSNERGERFEVDLATRVVERR